MVEGSRRAVEDGRMLLDRDMNNCARRLGDVAMLHTTPDWTLQSSNFNAKWRILHLSITSEERPISENHPAANTATAKMMFMPERHIEVLYALRGNIGKSWLYMSCKLLVAATGRRESSSTCCSM